MSLLFPARLGVTAVLLGTISTVALAETTEKKPETALEPIYVQLDGITEEGTVTTFSPGAMSVPAALDGGALLSTIPGISGSRMGGHGIDIILRGMSKNQLNVIDAGSFTYGGCPNRMDPPSSIATFYRASRVVVEKGYASVTNGPGAPAGTIRLEREAPSFESGKPVSGSFSLGGADNGGSGAVAGTVAVDLGHGFYLEASGEAKTASDYEDGSGHKVRSSYTQKSAGVTLGYRDNGVDLAFDVETDRAEDVEFAGASMDSPLSKTVTYRLRGGSISMPAR
ncbi:MAG: TonB-dependent receptor plug domain-containing protein [Paenirhodobacter sp.]|uniref:TonB-dependent receptor plug domain-containing protein n=1 Tax=Paenirhodobacter sp. TaxID=1965326 RepID=UPI003D113AEF